MITELFIWNSSSFIYSKWRSKRHIKIFNHSRNFKIIFVIFYPIFIHILLNGILGHHVIPCHSQLKVTQLMKAFHWKVPFLLRFFFVSQLRIFNRRGQTLSLQQPIVSTLLFLHLLSFCDWEFCVCKKLLSCYFGQNCLKR